MIDLLVGAGLSTQRCCHVLGVSEQGYDVYRRRPLSPSKMRRCGLRLSPERPTPIFEAPIGPRGAMRS